MATIRIHNLATGQTSTISRDVSVRHAPWIHAQLGTTDESELQHMLDGICLADYYDAAGNHRGPDEYGLEMLRDADDEVRP